ncbi:MAG: arsenate reductase ArsC [Candidatus Omnitrophica bacterium]|nr:arsenate reductase ArsC [Candidatus Omnitrophota bacterium]
MKKKRVLVLCTQNSARSQMAEGLFRHMAQERFKVESAGSKPSLVNPYAIKVLAEIGIDISSQRSKSLTEFIGQEFDYLITVCDNVAKECPVFPGVYKKIHWSLEDPAAVVGDQEKLEAFRTVRDRLKGLIFDFSQNQTVC